MYKYLLCWGIAVSIVVIVGSSEAAVVSAASDNAAQTAILAFIDVKEGPFYTPILWASNAGITSGTTATTFSPGLTCTRKQILTFIWRSEGKPEPPKGIGMPFCESSLDPESDFGKAVRWAYAVGLECGEVRDGKTYFDCESPCSRIQAVIYLWKLDKFQHESTTIRTDKLNFADVSQNDDYAEAVAWAVERGITDGNGTNEAGQPIFNPGKICNRGTIVTFLYRYKCPEQ